MAKNDKQCSLNVMTLNCKKYNFTLELILLSYLFKNKKIKECLGPPRVMLSAKIRNPLSFVFMKQKSSPIKSTSQAPRNPC